MGEAPAAPEEAFYDERLARFGPTAQGAGWNSDRAQELRFRELVRICEGVEGPVSINDYGCGYGALLPYLRGRGLDGPYAGYDSSPAMVAAAERQHGGATGARFVGSEEALEPADFTLASGLFGKPFPTPGQDWMAYVLATIDRLAAASTRGFAFNMLTTHSDPERMRDDLFYGDPTHFFEHCMRAYGGRVALLHGYELYDFTIHVLLEPRRPPPSEGS